MASLPAGAKPAASEQNFHAQAERARAKAEDERRRAEEARRSAENEARGARENAALALLGLSPGASRRDVKRAWREKMKSAHPDHGGSTQKATRLNEARDFLLGKR